MPSAAEHSMPPLSAAQAAHSAALRARIGDELRRGGGWLSFEEYLQLALYAPGLGYYSAGAVPTPTYWNWARVRGGWPPRC